MTTRTSSTCCYCGVGCGVVIESEGDRITSVTGDPTHPANHGKLCTKGSTLALTMAPPAQAGRARHPEMRAGKSGPRTRARWDDTLDHLADTFAACIRDHGPDSVGFYVSGQLLTEDYYVFNKLAKGLIGTANIDTNSRLCMASAVTGYQATLGTDAPPCSYEDIDHAQCLFIAGSNTAWAHPVLYRRIEAARAADPDLKVIVVDPRRTETAAAADLHLGILPGTDVALFNAMLHVMLWEEWLDRDFIAAHTAGFEALRTQVREMSPAVAAEICGVKAQDIVTAARWFATSPATLSLYCQGLNQSARGTAKNAALINLHLATGHIGRPGAGPFSLTGQPNAMGGREVGGMATTLAAHRRLDDPAHRAEVAALWGVDPDRLPAARGKTAVEMFEAVHRGEIRMLWIACTNPAQSMPDVARVREALAKAERVVLQEAFRDTETAAFADVLLPATSWAEKEGTVTNSERRISRVRAAVPGPGESRHDWDIACDFARRLEARLRPGRPGLFAFDSPEAIWNEHRACTRGRDLDITGLSYAHLDAAGPEQWPMPAGAAAGTARLYTDGRFATPDGRARFYPARYEPVAEKPDARFPLSLNTGRLRDHWHGMSRTGNVAQLFGHAPEPVLSANADDLARRGLADGDLVRVTSRRGAVVVRAAADAAMRSGQVFLPMHWGKRFLGGTASAGVNTLAQAAIDAESRQPELKHAAVKLDAAGLAWQLTAFARSDDAPALREALQALQDGVEYASAVLIGRESPGVLLRAAHAGAPDADWLRRIDDLLGLAGADVLRYDDTRRASGRRLRIEQDILVAARLSGDALSNASAEWLRAFLTEGRPVSAVRRLLLSSAARAPAGFAPAGRVVCQCHGATEDAIAAALREGGLSLAQQRTRCGTECGSCLPELKRLAAATPRAEAAA